MLRPSDPFMLHLYAALAEKERRLISDRTKAALRVKREQGVRLGNPHNIRVAGDIGRQTLVSAADQFAREILPAVNAIRQAGTTSLGGIAEALNKQGTERRGAALARVLRREPAARAKSLSGNAS